MSAHEHRDAAAAYALGAVDAAERANLDALMMSDPEFRREVDRYREVVGLMALAAPTVSAPRTLRERVLADATAVRPLAARAVSPHVGGSSVRRISAVLPWLAAAASLGVAVFTSSRLRASRDELRELSGDLTVAQAAIASRDSTLAAFLGPDVRVVSLSENTQQRPSARVYWNANRGVFIVTAFNVPRAPDGRTYQLWGIVKGRNPISMGTFNTDADGRATIVVPVTAELGQLGNLDLCGITQEPQGGSMQPTETPRLVGSWRTTD